MRSSLQHRAVDVSSGVPSTSTRRSSCAAEPRGARTPPLERGGPTSSLASGNSRSHSPSTPPPHTRETQQGEAVERRRAECPLQRAARGLSQQQRRSVHAPVPSPPAGTSASSLPVRAAQHPTPPPLPMFSAPHSAHPLCRPCTCPSRNANTRLLPPPSFPAGAPSVHARAAHQHTPTPLPCSIPAILTLASSPPARPPVYRPRRPLRPAQRPPAARPLSHDHAPSHAASRRVSPSAPWSPRATASCHCFKFQR